MSFPNLTAVFFSRRSLSSGFIDFLVGRATATSGEGTLAVGDERRRSWYRDGPASDCFADGGELVTAVRGEEGMADLIYGQYYPEHFTWITYFFGLRLKNMASLSSLLLSEISRSSGSSELGLFAFCAAAALI